MEHDHNRPAGQPVSIYLRQEILQAIDKQRGDRSRSGYLADLVVRDAWEGLAAPVPGQSPASAQIPPLLAGATAQHAMSRSETGGQIVDGTMVHPLRKVARDLEDAGHGASFSIEGGELPPGAEVQLGHHRLNPLRCQACRLTVENAPPWA